MADLGYFSLCLALFLAAYAIFSDLLGARFRDRALLRSGRNATSACWLCLCVAAAGLLVSLARCDFSLDYVARYTSRALPLPYRLSAFWAGAAGSLLLWLWMQVGIAQVVWYRAGRQQGQFTGVARAMTNLVAVFFLTVLLLDKNPFAVSSLPPADGAGLNPLLQHPAMVLHPPTLFVGYAAYSIPFAWAISVLAWPRTRPDASFFRRARNCMLVAWLFLSVGNALGSWWAYEELGWGGFWAWDPVENSSLMPWLTGTALLHSFKKYSPHSAMGGWVRFLSLATYSLCIFGTFLTRYGLVSSVHAFGDPGCGILFLMLLIAIWAVVAALRIRRHLSAGGSPSATPTPKAGILVLTNWVFLALVLVILLGTLFPFLSGLVSSNSISLQPEYFTRITSPGGLGLLLLLGLCPDFFRRGFTKSWRTILGVVAAAAAVAAWFIFDALAVPCFIICGYAAVNLGADFLRRHPAGDPTRRRATSRRGRPLTWYGARLAHIGVILMFVGMAGAEGYGIERQVALTPGQSVQASDYQLRFEQARSSVGPNYRLAVADIAISRNGTDIGRRHPGLAFYDSGQTTAEVDVRRTLADDLYIALTAMEDDGRLINLRVLVKPLINWLWIGAALMALGAIMVLASWTRRSRVTESVQL